jgi:hypothetical protein
MFDRHQEKKPMTEEEARPENTQPGALKPYGQAEEQRSLTDSILTGSLNFQQTKEQKTMTSAAYSPKKTQTLTTPKEAQDEFLKIKKALVGSNPEWCLPKANVQALESSPKLEQPVLSEDCKSFSPASLID